MPSSDKQKLLHDVLREGEDYQRFRSDVLRASTHEYRRYHRKKTLYLTLALAACAAFLLVLSAFFYSNRPSTPPLYQANFSGSSRAHSTPSQPATPTLPSSATDAPKTFELVETTPPPPIFVVRSVLDQSILVHTTPFFLPTINDTELLALFSDRPTAFVHSGSQKHFLILGPPRSISPHRFQ